MDNIYATDKVLYHPDKLADMRAGRQCYPVLLQLMPHNKCPHNCDFCSYRIEHNKNNELFDGASHIPYDVMTQLLNDFYVMGGKAIEATGGGEPLMYPYFDDMINLIHQYEFDYSLVTNGVLLTEARAQFIAPNMMWARVSIDAGSEETYRRIRHARPYDFIKALKAIANLRHYAKHPQFKLGAGFVVTNDNFYEIVDMCKLVKDAGADNVRISAVFHPLGKDYFNKDTIGIGMRLSREAEGLNDKNFHVYNLFDERINNLKAPTQDYQFCGTKELLCVIGGDCNVYYCCSLAFNKHGLIGNLKKQSFKHLWDSLSKKEQFAGLDARKCPVCLYELRNKRINELLKKDIPHVNFI
jgi:MoaA/NifB/PqqE/SkfB family radical SAM enzyme